jgi:hypothetical protein
MYRELSIGARYFWPVHDQRWRANRREHGAHVDVEVYALTCGGREAGWRVWDPPIRSLSVDRRYGVVLP